MNHARLGLQHSCPKLLNLVGVIEFDDQSLPVAQVLPLQLSIFSFGLGRLSEKLDSVTTQVLSRTQAAQREFIGSVH
jgi:hypothetical protein